MANWTILSQPAATTGAAFPLDFTGLTISGNTYEGPHAGDEATYDLASFLYCEAVGTTFTGRFQGACFKDGTFTSSVFSGDFVGCDFSNSTLTGASFTGNFTACTFVNTSMGSATLTGNFTGCDFTNVSMTSSTLSGNFTSCNFAHTTCTSMVATGSNLTASNWLGAILTSAVLHNTIWSGVAFNSVTLNLADFTGVPGALATNLIACSFINSSTEGTIFNGADLSGASFFQSGFGSLLTSPPTFANCNLTGTRFCNLATGNGFEAVVSYAPSYTALPWDANKLLSFTAAATLTLPSPPVSDTWEIAVQNASSGAVTISPAGLDIDGAAVSLTLSAGSGTSIKTDGTNYFTMAGGGGGSSSSPQRGLVFSIGSASSGVPLTTASTSGVLTMPFACTITGYELALGPGDSGTITVQFWKIAAGSSIPTGANSINTSGVGISTGSAIQSTTITDFTTTAIAANDMIVMAVSAISGTTIDNIVGVLTCG